MLAIRMQRTGRKGHAQFRLIVQDARRSPSSGRVVAQLGHYDPHSKATVIDKDKAAFYLEHGAQPSPRIIRILKGEKVKLPDWVEKPTKKTASIKNTEKLRRNRPAEPKAPVAESEAPAEEAVEAPAPEQPAEEAAATEPAPENEAAQAEPAVDESAKKEAKAEPSAEPASEEAEKTA